MNVLYILLRITCFELLFSNNSLLKPCTLIAVRFVTDRQIRGTAYK